MAHGRFSFRALTSLVLFWTFLAIVLSGAVLFIAPKGRIANWTGWQLLGLGKEQWGAVHTLMSIAFLVGGLFHLLKFNRRVIWAYVRRSGEVESPFRWAVIGSVVVSLAILVGTLAGVPPFATVVQVKEGFREGWGADAAPAAPIPHLEEQTLAQIAERLQLDPDEACESLRSQGVTCDSPSATLRQIAASAGRSPADVYRLLRPAASGRAELPGTGEAANPLLGAPGTEGHGAGWGRMTVAEVAAQRGLTVDEALASLAKHGIVAPAGASLRELASQHGLRPADLAGLLAAAPAPEPDTVP